MGASPTLGTSMPPITRKHVNQDFFKEWSSNMAYVLGYFVADGCISTSKGRPNNPYSFNITSKDLENLEKISKALNSTYRISKKSGSSKNIAYQIQIRNSILARDLMKLGIHPRKTYHLDPILVPLKYFADFTRGFFDGDGSVYIYTVNGTPQIKSSFIAVNFDFLKDFNGQLCKSLDIPEKSIHKALPKGINKMAQYSNCFYVDDSRKLAEFMYAGNPELCLQRKRDIFENWKSVRRRPMIKRNYPSKIGWRLSEGLKAV